MLSNTYRDVDLRELAFAIIVVLVVNLLEGLKLLFPQMYKELRLFPNSLSLSTQDSDQYIWLTTYDPFQS
jgi:hypothetical protein